MNTIGERIRYARKSKKLTIPNLKDLTGISTGNLSDLENNKVSPSANALIKLKEVLNISIDWILIGEDTACNTNKNESINLMQLSDLNEKDTEMIKLYCLLEENQKRDIEGYIKVVTQKFNLHK